MHRRRALTLFAGLGLCPLCASIGIAAEESHHWTYGGDTGPDNWGGLDAADASCSAGDQQSPIDIAGAISARQPQLRITWSKRPETIINNGHTIQLNFASGDTLGFGDSQYGLTQFEHLVEGKRFAMEAHFVHTAESGGLAVLGVFIVPGKANAVFNKIVSTMPEEEGPAVAADPTIDRAIAKFW